MSLDGVDAESLRKVIEHERCLDPTVRAHQIALKRLAKEARKLGEEVFGVGWFQASTNGAENDSKGRRSPFACRDARPGLDGAKQPKKRVLDAPFVLASSTQVSLERIVNPRIVHAEEGSHFELCPYDRTESLGADGVVGDQIVEGDDADDSPVFGDRDTPTHETEHGLDHILYRVVDVHASDDGGHDLVEGRSLGVRTQGDARQSEVAVRHDAVGRSMLAHEDGTNLMPRHGAGGLVDRRHRLHHDNLASAIPIERHGVAPLVYVFVFGSTPV
jgi:hypothetical protein